MNPINLYKIVKTKKSEKVKTFSSKFIHTQTMTMFMGFNLHMMMHAFCKGDKPLLHSLAVQNMYTKMTTGSKRVVVVVRNLTAIPIIHKKNNPVARVVAANAVPNVQIQPGRAARCCQVIQISSP